MNSKEIDSVLGLVYPLYYRGCISEKDCNKIIVPQQNSKHIWVINTSGNKIGHWILVHVANEREIEYFDSFGRSPEQTSPLVEAFIREKLKPQKISINNRQIQSPSSCVCGAYIIFVAHYMKKGYALNQIVSWFSTQNFALNDRSVYNWMRKIYLPYISKQRLIHCGK